MKFFIRAMTAAMLLAVCLAGCGGSSSGGDEAANTIVVSRSSAGTITAVANGGSRNLALGFNSSDSRPIGNLRVAGLSALPAGWSGAADFSCATVGSGNGCLLNLSYAPSTVASGAFTLTYTYTNSAGNTAGGSVEIAFAATAANNVVATASPAGQVAGIVDHSRAVTVTFATDDGNPASGLVLTSSLATLPAGWSSSGTAFGCASVAAGSACQLALVYAPAAIGGGTLTLDYSYLDNSGVAKTGTVNIPYTATSNNNVIATPLTPTVIDVRAGEAATVMLAFATDDGNAANAFTITSALPSGWSGATGLTCGGVIATSGCVVPFNYAPTAAASGTFTVSYSYSDNSGVAKTGSVDIVYNAKTAYVYAASALGTISYCPVSGVDGSLGSCSATANTISGPTGIVFHGGQAYVADNSTSVYVCTINSNGSFNTCSPSGSGFQQPFALASTATHLYAANAGSQDLTYCGFDVSGDLTGCGLIATSIIAPAGIAIATGTAYISDSAAGTVTTCAVDASTGNFSGCAIAASGFNQPLGITVADGRVYVVEQGNNTVSACQINNDGSLGSCSSQSVGSGPSSIAFFGSRAYVASAFDNSVYICEVNQATGLLSLPCSVNSDGVFSLPIQLGIH